MIFGAVPVAEAQGAILAHSLSADGQIFRKGLCLTGEHIALLSAAGITDITVARLENGDVPEDEAAHALADSACGPGLRIAQAVTGRCNLHAVAAGLLRVDAAAIDAANTIDEALTIATPADFARLRAGQLAATAKVIPYAAPRESLDRVTAVIRNALTVHPFQPLRTALIVTRTDALKPSLVEKGIRAVADRLASLGTEPPDTQRVEHDRGILVATIDAAMRTAPDLLLILAATATSDRDDVAPAALVDAGGIVERFGMPVDPGNLLVLARIGGIPAIVLPGCVRSPALNGADWVLERLVACLPVTGADIAAMGVGGLLKEMPGRPHPREGRR